MELEPISLAETTKNTIELLSQVRLFTQESASAEPTIAVPKLRLSTRQLAPDLKVAMPKLKLQQAIYNVYRWLSVFQNNGELKLSVKVSHKMTSLIITSNHLGYNRLEESISAEMSDKKLPLIVYGYLAQKIVARYGGSIKTSERQITLNLPLFKPKNSTTPTMSDKDMTDKINLITGLQEQPLNDGGPPDLNKLADARNLIDIVAKDLLVSIESMLRGLETSQNIDLSDKSSPWSAIRRKLRFFQVLTLDLQKSYGRTLTKENLLDLLDEVRLLLTHKIIDHNVTVESEVAEPILNTDRMRLLQVFVNLGLNAPEAMPKGKGTLSFNIKRNDKAYIVEVKDTGRGISADHLPRIFDLGFTTKVKSSAQDSGRGIGLNSVKTYVEQLNGSVTVNSEWGKGTTFKVTLPIY